MDIGVLKMIQERFDNAIKRYGEKVIIDGEEYDAVILSYGTLWTMTTRK